VSNSLKIDEQKEGNGKKKMCTNKRAYFPEMLINKGVSNLRMFI
jgi:hypothetical protein